MTSPGLIFEPSIIRLRSTTPTMRAGQVVFAALVHSGHLRGFAADECATAGRHALANPLMMSKTRGSSCSAPM